MLIRIEDGLPTTDIVQETEFCRRFPNVSFPVGLEGVDPSDYGFAWYVTADKPTPGRYEDIAEGTPVNVSHATWEQTWVLVPMSQQEREAVDDKQTQDMLNQKNSMLFACDWTQLPDSPLDDSEKLAWQTYRAQLRSVPQQPGFPWDIEWPQKPVT